MSQAAAHCAAALLRTGKGLGPAPLMALARAEAGWEACRTDNPIAYSPRRHVEALAALMAAEARAAGGEADAARGLPSAQVKASGSEPLRSAT